MKKEELLSIAKSIRSLSMDAIQKANSGHPGLPLGCAEIGAVLFGKVLKICPSHTDWINRDRFVLSAGHGSMLLYSLLHLAGFGLPLEEIKNFRQLGSKTPGHPEYGLTPGVETTTGPLGAGFGNAVGMAIAERHLSSRFNTEKHRIIDHYTYVLAGDGCMMEGVASEAASLAGHLRLGKLIAIYDSNSITIEGSTDLAFTENVGERFSAYGWQVLKGDAHDTEAVAGLIAEAKRDKDRPSLVILKSVIAKGSPKFEGSEKAHGAPLGEDEIRAAKKNLGIPEDEHFWVDPAALRAFSEREKEWLKDYESWNVLYSVWRKDNPGLAEEWDKCFSPMPENISWPAYKPGEGTATRSAGGAALKAAAAACPGIIGGSADLAPSNNTDLPYGSFSYKNPSGRTLHFGVREHGMGAVVNGLALYGGLRTFCATFLVFSDYMRPAIRLAALMKLPVIYIFTHDSFFVGEDGPTHQPVEHLAALRVIPDLAVFRPADGEETNAAWKLILKQSRGPAVLALTRQKLPVMEKPKGWEAGFSKGAYVVKESKGPAELVILATGSEVSLALETAELLKDKNIRVVSVPCRELFMAQPESYKTEIIPSGSKAAVIEAGVALGWEGLASGREYIISLDRFGESGPGEAVAKHLGFSAETAAAKLRKL